MERLNIKNISDLRLIYISRIYEELQHFETFFAINDKPIALNELLEDENFEYLVKDEAKYRKQEFDPSYRRISQKKTNLPLFTESEKKVDLKKKYYQREKEIIEYNSDKISELKFEIKNLEKKKLQTRNFEKSLI